MSFRQDEKGVVAWLQDLERRLRRVEQGGSAPPDRGWILKEIDGGLYYVYVPSGAQGPQIGTKS